MKGKEEDSCSCILYRLEEGSVCSMDSREEDVAVFETGEGPE